jgi:hypothetical protein
MKRTTQIVIPGLREDEVADVLPLFEYITTRFSAPLSLCRAFVALMEAANAADVKKAKRPERAKRARPSGGKSSSGGRRARKA